MKSQIFKFKGEQYVKHGMFEITNCKYKPIEDGDKYFSIAFKKVMFLNPYENHNEEFQSIFSFSKNSAMADILGISTEEFHNVALQYNAMSNIDGGHLFFNYEDAKQFMENFINPLLTIVALSQ